MRSGRAWSASRRGPVVSRARHAWRPAALCAVAHVALLLQACVVVPRTTQVFDEGCRTHARQMALELEQVAYIGGCADQGCAALLLAAGVVTAVSAVVSGSIVVAGNVVYWFEKRGRCDGPP
jgi:hypothetical protein